jgi:hypothetical protein
VTTTLSGAVLQQRQYRGGVDRVVYRPRGRGYSRGIFGSRPVRAGLGSCEVWPYLLEAAPAGVERAAYEEVADLSWS